MVATILNAGFQDQAVSSTPLVLPPAPPAVITLYEAEMLPSAGTDSPYLASSDYGTSPAASKLYCASLLGVPSRRSWTLDDGTGLVLPAGIGITAYSNPTPTLINTGTFNGLINAPTVPGMSVTLGWTPTSGNVLTVGVVASGSLWQDYLSIAGNAVGGGSWPTGGGTPPDNEVGGGFFASSGGGTHGKAATFYGFVGSSPGTTVTISNPGGGGIFPTYSWAIGLIIREWSNVSLSLDSAGGQTASGSTGNFHCYSGQLAYACAVLSTASWPSSPWVTDSTTETGAGPTLVDAWQIPGSSGNVSATFSASTTYATAAESFGSGAGGETVSCGVAYSVG